MLIEEKSIKQIKQNVFYKKIKKNQWKICKKKLKDNKNKNKTFLNEKIMVSNKNDFFEKISLKENKEDIELIEEIKKDKAIIEKMDIEELRKICEAIKRRQMVLDKKVEQLKNEIAIKKFQSRKKN